jgi:hypothetical protein
VTTEEQLVRQLGDRIGYGRLMQLAEEQWRAVLVDSGLEGGEFSVGPCAAELVPCPCPPADADHAGHCPWCCGVGRVTKRVFEAIWRASNP